MLQIASFDSKLVPDYKWDSPTPIEVRESAPKIQIFILLKETQIARVTTNFIKHPKTFKCLNVLILSILVSIQYSLFHLSILVPY